MKAMSAGIWALLRLGGARVRRVGRIPTAEPVLIVSNHQSLTDILQITLMSTPRVPAFVTRRRYERYVPLVSACIRMLGCPIVDPKRDPAGSVEAIRRGARELPNGIIIFPEGHRSRDGELLPFRAAGLLTVLEERKTPVYLVLNEGAWRVARFSDLLFRVHLDRRLLGSARPLRAAAGPRRAARLRADAARHARRPPRRSPPGDRARLTAASRPKRGQCYTWPAAWRCGWHDGW